MAKSLSKSGISTGNTVKAFHVTQSIDAFTGIDAYDIVLSGSLEISAGNVSGSSSSTASFGTYLGDGSQLLGISTTPFPFTGSAAISGTLSLNGPAGHITASGNISASGDVTAVTASLQQIILPDNSKISNTPAGHKIEFNNGELKLISGDDVFLQLDDTITFANAEFIVPGNITAGGTISNISTTNITASGNVSSSAVSTASFGTYLGDGSQLTGISTGSVGTLQQVTTAGNTTDQALIVTGSSIFRTTTGAGAGGRIELSNGNYSSINSPVMSFVDSSDYNNVVIGQSVNDGLIQVYDHPSQLRTVIAANFVCFDPGQTGTAGVYFGVTSSAADGSNRSYVRIKESGYSGIPYHTLNIAHKSGGTTSGSITLGGISQASSTSAPSIQIASNDGVRVVNFGGPGFNHSNGVHNNYLKYGLQIGGDYTGYTSNMPLTDGSLIMSGSTGGFSLKSVSSEAEIKTNNGTTTLTLGTTSSFSYVSASAFKGDGSQLTGISAGSSIDTGSLGNTTITGSLTVSGSGGAIIQSSGSTVFNIIGSEGDLFTVTDNLTTGSLFSVKDVSGIPLLDVTSNSTISNVVTVVQSNLLVDSGSLEVVGNTTITGNISASGDIDGKIINASQRVSTPALRSPSNGITIQPSTPQVTIVGNITASSYQISSSFVGEATNIFRPIITIGTNPFTASADTAGGYYRMGGNVTCSIILNATASCPIGSEFEFFQTSSAGYVLFETGSANITLNSKSGNIKLAGQFSAATLKKVGNDEWDLIGDLG